MTDSKKICVIIEVLQEKFLGKKFLRSEKGLTLEFYSKSHFWFKYCGWSFTEKFGQKNLRRSVPAPGGGQIGWLIFDTSLKLGA